MQVLHFPIRVPGDVLEALGAFTGHFWSDSLALEPYICEAIRNYINSAPTSAPATGPRSPTQSRPQSQPQPQPQSQSQSEAQPQPAMPSELGYQWKEVFLPEGTRLRASFGRQPYFATVAGSEIKYGEHAVSPSCFANLYGSGNRNAWKAIWLRLPGKDAWLLADLCRAGRKAAIARLLTEDALEKQQPGRAVASAATVEPRRALPPVRPAARQPGPGAAQARPPVLPAALGDGARAGDVAGKRPRRRKRRAKKHGPTIAPTVLEP
jgi:hypothetical protein